MKMRSTHRWAAVAIAAGLALTGCGGRASADKAGGETVVLHFATIDAEPTSDGFVDLETFAVSIEQVSGGRIDVEIATSYGSGASDAESGLVEAIASGEIDGGNPASRAFGRAGIPGLETLEAPMTITSYPALKELVSGNIADGFLARLDGSGLVGLGLVVGELRRPFAVGAPLLGPEDWEGTRFRTFNSQVQADSVLALGGEPIDLYGATANEIVAGRLDGFESAIRGFWAAGGAAGGAAEVNSVTANVVLWPKVPVLSLSQARWDSLSEDQRAWVREAAEQAVTASIEATYDETTPAGHLCEEGVRLLHASPEQVVALKESVAPVVADLAEDPLWSDIAALAARFPEAETPDVVRECQDPVPAGTDDLGPVPDTAAALPDGLYRVEITLADVEQAGRTNASGWTGTWTLEIADGAYAMRCRPIDDPGIDCGHVPYGAGVPFDSVLDAGFVRGEGATVYFVYDQEMHSGSYGCGPGCVPLPTYRFNWELDGDALTFSDLVGVDETEKEIKPWEKIG